MDKQAPEFLVLQRDMHAFEEALRSDIADLERLEVDRKKQTEQYIQKRDALKKLGIFAIIRNYDLWKKTRDLAKNLKKTQKSIASRTLSKDEKELAMKSRIDEYIALYDSEYKMLAVIYKGLQGLSSAAEFYQRDLVHAHPLFTELGESLRSSAKILEILDDHHNGKKIGHALAAVRDAGRLFSEAVQRYYDPQNPRVEDGVTYPDAEPWKIVILDGKGGWDLVHTPHFMDPFEPVTLGEARNTLISLEEAAHALSISITRKGKAVKRKQRNAHLRVTMAVCDRLWWSYDEESDDD